MSKTLHCPECSRVAIFRDLNPKWPNPFCYSCKAIGESIRMEDAQDTKAGRSQYEFSIRHHSQLDFNKIAKDLDYNNPMAVVEVGKKTFLIIHDSVTLADKVVVWNYVPGLTVENLPGACVYDCSGYPKAIDETRDRIREIKLSKWKNDSLYDGTVTVTVSQI